MKNLAAEKLEYRADIDGLRALAVISILFYHVGFEAFSGAFVGVDIFFIISGFLITRLIVHESANDTFNLFDFYTHRIRRLFPALFATIALCLLAGYFILIPADLARFSGAALHAVLSISNFYFWFEAGYFDTSAFSKPLLHTWSLGIEEQFYLIWPIALIFLVRSKSIHTAPMVIAAAAFLSLLAAEYMIARDQTAAFYLLPFRAFEFAIGGLLVWLPKEFPPNAKSQNLLWAIGLSLILIAIFNFKAPMHFPGISALLPCIGTALMIVGGSGQFGQKMLGNGTTKHVGRISYCIYLVHWPLIVFYSYYTFDDLSNLEKLGLITCTLIAAEILHRTIEEPFRKRKGRASNMSPRLFGSITIASAVLLIAVSATVWFRGGFSRATSTNIFATDNTIETRLASLLEETEQRQSDKEIVFIGDSSAMDLHASYILSQTNERLNNFKVSMRAKGGCRPVVGPSVSYAPSRKSGQLCEAFFQETFNEFIETQPKAVFLYARWGGVAKFNARVKSASRDTIKFLLKNTKSDIIFVDYAPDYKKPVQEGSRLLFRLSETEFNQKLESSRNRAISEEFDNFFRELAATSDRVHFLSLKEFLCPNGQCVVFENGNFLVADKVHLTSHGKVKTAAAIDKALEKSGLLERWKAK